MNNEQLTPEERIAALKGLADQLQDLFPGDNVTLTKCASFVSLDFHGCKTYAEATEWFRSLGIQVRQKNVYPDYTAVEGIRNGIIFRTYPNELPPTCRKEKVVERIPKQHTVDTGEYVEVERERIVCGEADTAIGKANP